MPDRGHPRLVAHSVYRAAVENALSFFERAAQEFPGPEPPIGDAVKYSTIHLYEGIELLLKATLMREHWSLVVRGTCTMEDFVKGDFVSIPFADIDDRLHKVCGVQLPPEARNAFNQLRELRNRFVHFHCSASDAEVVARQGEAWRQVVALVDRGALSLESVEALRLRKLREHLQKREKAIDDRFLAVQVSIQDERSRHSVVTCPCCRKEALVLKDSGTPRRDVGTERRAARCLVCERADVPPEQLAVEWIGAFVSRSADPPTPDYCSECQTVAVVPFGQSGIQHASSDHVCLSCGHWWNREHDERACSYCGERVFGAADFCTCSAWAGWEYAEEEENLPETEDGGGEQDEYDEAGEDVDEPADGFDDAME